jgi:hypothetical protein
MGSIPYLKSIFHRTQPTPSDPSLYVSYEDKVSIGVRSFGDPEELEKRVEEVLGVMGLSPIADVVIELHGLTAGPFTQSLDLHTKSVWDGFKAAVSSSAEKKGARDVS